MKRQSVVYLYHFDKSVSSKHNCQHYLGSTIDLLKRDQLHRKGKGAKLIKAVLERGINIEIVRVWYTDNCRKLEKELKAQHNNRKLCPYCTGQHKEVNFYPTEEHTNHE